MKSPPFTLTSFAVVLRNFTAIPDRKQETEHGGGDRAGQDIVTGVPQKHSGTAQLPSCNVNNGAAMYIQHPNVAKC